jgi:hypothetical protein
MLPHLSGYKYVIEKWYDSHSFHLHVNTVVSGSYNENLILVRYIYAVNSDTNKKLSLNSAIDIQLRDSELIQQ